MQPNSGQAYQQIVQQLPPPTWQQTECFARFVSNAHSWYKHLPLHPKVPFYFYLDPNAGKNQVWTRTGELAFLEITDDSPRFHYTWQTTHDYRELFGFWNYYANYGTSFQYAGEGGVIDTSRELQILAPTGEWEAIPTELQAIGRADVSAILHPYPSITIWKNHPEGMGLSENLEPTNSALSALPSSLRRLWQLLDIDSQLFSSLEALLNPELPKEIEQFIQESMQQPEARHRAWRFPHREWWSKVEDLGATPAMRTIVFQQVERQRQQNHLERCLGIPQSGEATTLFRELAWAIAQERVQQLQAMLGAMNQFIGAIYGDEASH